MSKGFEGWYFKHQNGDDVVAFIPGISSSGNFIQVIVNGLSKHIDVNKIAIERGAIVADDCIFSRHGCSLNLPGIKGQIKYSNLTRLKTDIMGPFKHLPMQCHHSIISMEHDLHGSITIDGKLYSFTGGKGYIEKDRGTSFPQSYMWLQCNSFSKPCSFMLSIAHIPFCYTSFTGCICAIIYQGHEYRLATYNGVHIHSVQSDHICLSQGHLLLEINITPPNKNYVLKSPVNGIMSGKIRESCNSSIRVRLWKNRIPILNLHSSNAMYEYVPKPNK